MSPRRAPHEMRVAPALAPGVRPGPVEPRYALLINPFYPKDPHTSFGKHVLTPSLALTSIAAATPPHWHVHYWDENLLQGPPPGSRFRKWWASPCTSHLPSGRMSWPAGIGGAGRR